MSSLIQTISFIASIIGTIYVCNHISEIHPEMQTILLHAYEYETGDEISLYNYNYKCQINDH